MDEDIYLNLLSMLAPLRKKNITLIRQIITPHERVSAILRILATSQSYEDLKYSRAGVARLWEVVIYFRELNYFAIYFDSFSVT